LLAEAEGRGWRVYFIGATQEVLARFLSAAREEHPHLQIAGSRDGYFDERDESEIAAAVREAGPDLLFVGISSPKKEFFLARNLEKMGVPFAMGVGGAFDVGARVVRRAPVWMQRAGLEWFHRLLQEPRRMWRRYVFGNARFAGRVIRELVRRP
jgi:N-acetylglucosaminyldiphosphoundecaprenol N-acetyl-beta-D-mannosaminyltransferase